MDGGIDYSLSRIIFPNIEPEVKRVVRQIGITSIVGKPYLPIGSSIIIHKENIALVVSPTMLLPQNVSTTRNAYYATMSVLYNILVNQKEDINNIDILLTSFCCGYGKMDEDVSFQQMMEGIRDYTTYTPQYTNDNIVIHEPNLYQQPPYYQNTEFFSIRPEDIVRC